MFLNKYICTIQNKKNIYETRRNERNLTHSQDSQITHIKCVKVFGATKGTLRRENENLFF